MTNKNTRFKGQNVESYHSGIHHRISVYSIQIPWKIPGNCFQCFDPYIGCCCLSSEHLATSIKSWCYRWPWAKPNLETFSHSDLKNWSSYVYSPLFVHWHWLSCITFPIGICIGKINTKDTGIWNGSDEDIQKNQRISHHPWSNDIHWKGNFIIMNSTDYQSSDEKAELFLELARDAIYIERRMERSTS